MHFTHCYIDPMCECERLCCVRARVNIYLVADWLLTENCLVADWLLTENCLVADWLLTEN